MKMKLMHERQDETPRTLGGSNCGNENIISGSEQRVRPRLESQTPLRN